MKVKELKAFVAELKFKEPFTISAGTSYSTKNIIIVVEDDNGLKGFGEACPSFRVNRETVESNLEALRKLAPEVIKLSPLNMERVREALGKVKGNPSIKAALETALWDLLGKEIGKPLYNLLGGYREFIETDLTISLKAPEEMAYDAKKAVEMGFSVVKVKVGRGLPEDIRRVEVVREAVGDEIRIRVDVNEGWDLEEALRALPKLAELKVELCEQPLKANDLKGLAKLRKEGLVPIMVDESVHDSKEVLKVIEMEAADYINIKLMKCGGISEALRIAYIAEASGIKCMIGCMGESELGIAAATHVAQGVKNIEIADLDSDILLADKLVEEGSVTLNNGLRKALGPGIGVKKLKEGLLPLVGRWVST